MNVETSYIAIATFEVFFNCLLSPYLFSISIYLFWRKSIFIFSLWNSAGLSLSSVYHFYQGASDSSSPCFPSLHFPSALGLFSITARITMYQNYHSCWHSFKCVFLKGRDFTVIYIYPFNLCLLETKMNCVIEWMTLINRQF